MVVSVWRPAPFVLHSLDPDSIVTAITSAPPFHRLTDVYGIPPFTTFDPNAHLTFWVRPGAVKIFPHWIAIFAGVLRMFWPINVLGQIMHHDEGPPYVHNAIGGVLVPFALPIPYSA